MRIKVGDEFLDVFNSEIIAQTYQVNEIGNITTRQGGFSNDFTLPLTEKNKSILGYPENVNSSSNNPYEKVDASLFDQGALVADGYLRYTVVNNQQNIEVSFFSDNVEWFTLLKDKSLNELDLSEFDHVWSAVSIVDVITANKDSGYTYPLIDYGEFRNLTALSVESNQMFPATFISTIVDRIFFEIGWKVEGEMIDHPLYKRMIIPFSAKALNHSQDYIDDNTQGLVLPATQSGLATVNATVPLIWVLPSTSDITIDEPGEYNVRLVCDIDFTQVGAGLGNFAIRNNAIPLFDGPQYGTFTGQVVIDTNLTLEAGVIDAVLETAVPPASSLTYNIFLTTTTIVITPLETVLPGSTIQLGSTLPDIKQSDLLNYLAFVFGAVPQANNLSKTVNFGLFKSIKDNIPDALDWSDKVDLSKDNSIDFTELLQNYSGISVLKYAEDDNDDELSAYLAETSKTFGEGQIEITNEHVTGKDTIYEAPFSPMININSFDNTMYIPQIAFKRTGENDLEPEPKIAILSENFSVSTLSIDLYSELNVLDSEDGYTTISTANIPFCWFAKTEYIGVIDSILDSLAFDQILFPNAVGEPLIDRFLKDYEDILNAMKYVKHFIHLTEKDINELDFLIPIYLELYKAYFYISKINNYEGSSRTTEAEIVKIS